MELVNCKECGRMFGSQNGELYCSKCRVNDDAEFKKVREYLYDNPGASVQEVAEGTGVSETLIIKFLKQERIEIVEDENAILSCERCRKSIKTGRYCEICKAEIKKELANAAKSLKESKGSKATYHSYNNK
ncbi:flagellar protein [Tepidibacter aestuarii]|uniref:flagellar protein n=1 Tax=Tepidibacter aestuarii TaxID=2925782 RepID=UPI0020BFDF9E|nr:flagellar protein [Tepidibacter aestuarii]CAH2211876.1 transcriptional regulator of flagella formation [Tepidibacter aestuarii]